MGCNYYDWWGPSYPPLHFSVATLSHNIMADMLRPALGPRRTMLCSETLQGHGLNLLVIATVEYYCTQGNGMLTHKAMAWSRRNSEKGEPLP